MKKTFTFLGSGRSLGIPVVGCHCKVCSSSSSFNKRLRSSGLLCIGEKQFLIDAGPDFRLQALQHHINALDGFNSSPSFWPCALISPTITALEKKNVARKSMVLYPSRNPLLKKYVPESETICAEGE